MAKTMDDLVDEAFYEATMDGGDFEDILTRKIIQNDMDVYDEANRPYEAHDDET